MELFITKLFEQPAFYVSMVASFAGSICAHEYCHAFVAHHLGDNTAKEGGYMTVNPLKVMGWMSIAALLLFGFSWGAVPVKRDDPNRLRRSVISLAGPLSNLLLLLIAALLLKVLYAAVPTAALDGGFIYYCRLFLICGVYANAILFLFNIIPIPVLDGWGIIEPFLPKSLIPSEKNRGVIFKLFIYVVCFSSASGHFDKALEIFARNFLPSQVNTISLVNDGVNLLNEKNYSGSYQAFSKAAEQGSPEGKMYLALCLIEGYGCNTNPEKAFALLNDEKVLESQPSAKYLLGIMYFAGNGTKQDFAKAASLLKAAADAGEPNAAQFLGYQDGKMPDFGCSLEELLKKHWEARK